MKRLRALSALALAVLLAGCSILPYEDPEEQRRQEALTPYETAEPAASFDPLAMQGEDLVFSNALRASSGAVLARYEVTLPAFETDDTAAGQSLARINAYYEEQLTGCREDCTSFFSMVQSRLGEEWSRAPASDYAVTLTYALISAPANYLCVVRTYTMEGGGTSERYQSADVFLLDSGWRLSLAELFGSHYEQAQPLLLEGIRAWCVQNGMTEEGAAALAMSDFELDYGIDSVSLLFFVRPFALSAADGEGHIIRLPLSELAELLPESITVPSDDVAPAEQLPDAP